MSNAEKSNCQTDSGTGTGSNNCTTKGGLAQENPPVQPADEEKKLDVQNPA